MVSRLDTMNELSKETVYIDGTKLKACANKYTFVWKKSVGKWEEKMFNRIQDAVQLLSREYIQSFCVSKETRTEGLQKNMDFLDAYCREHSVVLFMMREKKKHPSEILGTAP